MVSIIQVYGDATEDIKQIVMDVLWSLFMKMNLPVDEAQKMVEEVEKSGMGYLFENFEKCDIQEERRKTKEGCTRDGALKRLQENFGFEFSLSRFFIF